MITIGPITPRRVCSRRTGDSRIWRQSRMMSGRTVAACVSTESGIRMYTTLPATSQSVGRTLITQEHNATTWLFHGNFPPARPKCRKHRQRWTAALPSCVRDLDRPRPPRKRPRLSDAGEGSRQTRRQHLATSDRSLRIGVSLAPGTAREVPRSHQ